MATVIRVHVQEQAAPPLDFNLADFAGQLPEVGDLIVPPDPTAARDTVWEVVFRAFDPGRAFDAESCLRVVVRSRPMTPEEQAFFA